MPESGGSRAQREHIPNPGPGAGPPPTLPAQAIRAAGADTVSGAAGAVGAAEA
ncbi:Bcr/CflA family drug resistance efflux transporter, partial [Streptomyces sp. ZEA17I]